MEFSHGRDLSGAETAPKTASQISRELFDNLLPVAGSFLPRLLVLDDAPSDFPIRRCRLGAPASVPPLTSPPPPRPLLLGFHRRELSLGDSLNRSCLGGPTGLKIVPVTNSLNRMR